MLLKLRRKLMFGLGHKASGMLDHSAVVRGNLLEDPDLEAAFRLYDADDFRAAFEMFHRAALNGNAAAQYNLGVCCETGVGTTRDDCAAEEWYRRAAEQGLAEAQYALTVVLVADIMAGQAVGRSEEESHARLVEGYAWLLCAKANGYSEADIAIQRLGAHMRPDQIALGKTRAGAGTS